MDHPPRLLWITERYPPLPGGMAVSAARQTGALRRRGFDLDVLAFTETGSKALIRSEPRTLGNDHHFSRTVRQGRAAMAAWRMAEREQIRRPYGFTVGFGAGRAGHLAVTFAAWLGCRSLVLVRGNDFERDYFESGRGYFVKDALSRADVIGAVTPDLVRRIQALFPQSDVRYLPNGVDAEELRLLPADLVVRDEARAELPDDGRAVVGLFGELKYKKGVAFWLGALRDAGLLDRLALLIVGRGMDEDTRQILEDPALSPPSFKVPFTSRDRLPGLYAACDFVALPSFHDGMPNVLLEAMSLGVTPIVSTAGAMGELVQDGRTGFIFPVEDRQAAARATARALDMTGAERREMSGRIKDFIARNYSVEQETDRLADLFQNGRPSGAD